MTRAILRNPPQQLPTILRWEQSGDPLPRRIVRVPKHSRQRTLGLETPEWWKSGPTEEPFDFCGHVRNLCADIVKRCAALRHIDVNRLLFAVTQARSGTLHGLQARVTPLRFAGGQLTRQRGRTRYRVQRYIIDNVEMLYLVTFCLPRFLEQNFDDKFVTLFHELYHISPAFEGDLRRLEGRCDIHSSSKREYDAHMAVLARAYLGNGADPALHGFLRMDFAQLEYRHGSIVGVVVPRPRLLPIEESASKE